MKFDVLGKPDQGPALEMNLRAVKYVGDKETKRLVMRGVPLTHPKDRFEYFAKGEVKIIGRDILPDRAEYLLSTYPSLIKLKIIESTPQEYLVMMFRRLCKQLPRDFLDSIMSLNDVADEFFRIFTEVHYEETKTTEEEESSELSELVSDESIDTDQDKSEAQEDTSFNGFEVSDELDKVKKEETKEEKEKSEDYSKSTIPSDPSKMKDGEMYVEGEQSFGVGKPPKFKRSKGSKK